MPFNVYDDAERAAAYARLEFPGTYHLAFRDLPEIFSAHIRGTRALDFGCGAGRSTRFLKGLGFDAMGIDISASMIKEARELDTSGCYLLLDTGDFGPLGRDKFDLIMSAFAFDNIPGNTQRTQTLAGLRKLLRVDGRIVILGSTPDIYKHEWASFTTKEFPENWNARSGEEVRIVMTDVPDARPVVDLIWFHEDYLELFATAGMKLLAEHRPLGRPDEPYPWVTETSVAPWVIYVLGR